VPVSAFDELARSHLLKIHPNAVTQHLAWLHAETSNELLNLDLPEDDERDETYRSAVSSSSSSKKAANTKSSLKRRKTKGKGKGWGSHAASSSRKKQNENRRSAYKRLEL